MKTLAGLALASLLAVPAVAQAGYKAKFPVYIDLTNHFAEGAMGSARNSLDTAQQLSCAVSTYYGVSSGFCYAQDAQGQNVICWFDEPAYVETLHALSSDSFIHFEWSPTDNHCTWISTQTGSWAEPKK